MHPDCRCFGCLFGKIRCDTKNDCIAAVADTLADNIILEFALGKVEPGFLEKTNENKSSESLSGSI